MSLWLKRSTQSPNSLQPLTHRSATPEALQAGVIAGFAKGTLPAHAHYLTSTQATLWHELAKTFHTRASGDVAFDIVFKRLADELTQHGQTHVELIALGAASARKESNLVATLQQKKISTSVTFVDVLSDLLVAADLTFQNSTPDTKVRTAHVADIAAVALTDLIELIGRELSPQAIRIVSLFGVLPALESPTAVEFAMGLLRPGDLFVLSTNLLPAGRSIVEIAEFYDSPLARDWLQQILREVGLDPGAADWQLTSLSGLAAVKATHTIRAQITTPAGVLVKWGDATAELAPGSTVEVFRSHRHSPESIKDLVSALGLDLIDWQVSPSGEEGVALMRVRA